jgi:hypothetical protein
VSLSEQQIAMRLKVARHALEGYGRYWEDLAADRLPPDVLADLVTSTKWMVEVLEVHLPQLDAALRRQIRGGIHDGD